MDRPDGRAARVRVQHEVLDKLEAWVAACAPGRASVSRFESDVYDLVELVILPENPAAVSIDANAGREEMVLELGRAGARWELTYDDDQLELARAIVEAVAGGCTVELTRRWPPMASITRSGATRSGAGFVPLLPIAGSRRSRTAEYEPY